MTVFYIILAASPVLLLLGTAFLVIVIIGIRKGDHGDLYEPPRNAVDAFARRVAGVGVRSNNPGDE